MTELMKMRDFEAAAAVIAFGWLLCGCSVKPAGGDDNGEGNGAGGRAVRTRYRTTT